MLFESIIVDSLRLYFKNIVVNLFFSALMFLFPYLQYMLILSGQASIFSAVLVFASGFASVLFVYIPFIISIHKARISKLWRTVFRDATRLSAFWAAIYAMLFFAMLRLISNARLSTIVILGIFLPLLTSLWQIMILNAVHIVCNASNERKNVSLKEIFCRNKLLFMLSFLCGIFLLIYVPLLYQMKMHTNMLKYPRIENPDQLLYGEPILTARELTTAIVFLLIPLFAIALYKCYVISLGKTNER